MFALLTALPSKCRSLLTMMSIIFQISSRAEVIYLNSSYMNDLYLDATNTSYHLSGDVSVGENATLFISNGVEIVFEGHYKLWIYGSINSGCYQYDTKNIHKRGLADPSNHVIIRANDMNSAVGVVYLKPPAKTGRFCNTKFIKLNIGIQFEIETAEEILIDNCEFADLGIGIRIGMPSLFHVNDTIMWRVSCINQYSSGIYDNCEFREYYELFGDIRTWFVMESVSIINSKLEASMTKTAIEILPYVNVIGHGIFNNVIINALYGIYIHAKSSNNNQSIVYIGHNNISNTIYGCRIVRSDVIIDGNIFDNNIFHLSFGNDSSSIHELNISHNIFRSSTNIQSGIQIQNASVIYIDNNDFINNTIAAGDVLIETNGSNNIHIDYNTFIGNIFTSSSSLYRSDDDLNIHFKGNNIVNNIAGRYTFDILKIKHAMTVNIEHNIFNNLILSNNTSSDVWSFNTYFIWMNQVYGSISIEYNEFMLANNNSMKSYISITSSDNAKIEFNNFYLNTNHYGSIWLENTYNTLANLNYFSGLENLFGVIVDSNCQNINNYTTTNISNLFLNPINFDNPDLSQLCILDPVPMQCGMNTSCYIHTSNPTSFPTVNPTEIGAILIYAVKIELSFKYIVNNNDTMIIKQIITNIINDTLIEQGNSINIIDCIDDSESNFLVQSVNDTNGTFINATILICDESSQDIVLNAFTADKLYRDIIDKADKNGLYIILKENDVKIVGDKIYKYLDRTTTSILSETINNNNGKEQEENDNITNILIGIGCGLFMCVLIICLICCCKIKKLKIESKNEQKQLEIGISRDPQRVKSISHNNHNSESNTNIQDMVENIDNDENTPSMEKDKNDNNDNIMDDNDEKYIVSLRTEGNDNNININNDDDDNNKLIMKQWLTDIVGLPQYYHIFIENGFESLMFIQEIIDKKELQEIGIENIEHQIKVIQTINELKQNHINKAEIILNNDDEFEVLGDDQTSGK